MIDEIIYELPKGIEMSHDIKLRSFAYMTIHLFGRKFYVPITTEVKKLVGFHVVDGKIEMTYKQHQMLGKVFQDAIRGMELQMKQEIAIQIEDALMSEVKEGFAKLFADPISKLVKEKLDQKLLEGGNHDRTTGS